MTTAPSTPARGLQFPALGLHRDVRPEVYHAAAPMSIGTLTKAYRTFETISMAHLRHAIENPDVESTDAQNFGTAFHMAVLEPARYAVECVVKPTFEGKGAVAARKAWEAEHADFVVIYESDVPLIQGMADAIRRHPEASRLVANAGPCEASCVWDDPETGVRCKLRIDKFIPGVIALDLKSARNAAPDAFCRDVLAYRYHNRLAWYQDGLRIVTGEQMDVTLVVVESKPLHAVQVYVMEDDALDLGRRENKALLRKYAACRESGVWPGYAEGVQPIGVPDWYFRASGGHFDE